MTNANSYELGNNRNRQTEHYDNEGPRRATPTRGRRDNYDIDNHSYRAERNYDTRENYKNSYRDNHRRNDYYLEDQPSEREKNYTYDDTPNAENNYYDRRSGESDNTEWVRSMSQKIGSHRNRYDSYEPRRGSSGKDSEYDEDSDEEEDTDVDPSSQFGASGLGIDIDHFINHFINNAEKEGMIVRLTCNPERRPSGQRDKAIFCMGDKTLCFTAIWDRGNSQLHSILMVYAGDGSSDAHDNLISSLHAMISTITPKLNRKQRNTVLERIGFIEGIDGGNTFVAGQNNKQIEYVYNHTPLIGVALMAIAR